MPQSQVVNSLMITSGYASLVENVLTSAEPITVDAGGNIFGTSSQGGSFFTVCDFGCGTAWEVSP